MSDSPTLVCLERCGVSPLHLHWLRIPERITFRLAPGGFGSPLSEWTCTTVPCWWPSSGGGGRVTATAAFGGDCGKTRPSHVALCFMYRGLAVIVDMHHITLLMTFTRRRRSSYGDCGTDRPSHGAFYDRPSHFLYLCRFCVEQPSALGDVISVPSCFPKAS